MSRFTKSAGRNMIIGSVAFLVVLGVSAVYVGLLHSILLQAINMFRLAAAGTVHYLHVIPAY